MVEAVHAHRTKTRRLHVAVPTLPDRRRALIDGIEPARVLVLEQERVGDVGHAVLGESVHQDRRAEEACLQTVAVVGNVLLERGGHARLRLALDESELEREKRRGLHSAQHGDDETVCRSEEFGAHVRLRLLGHLLVLRRVASCRRSHLGHHPRVPEPVASAEVVPVHKCVGLRAALSVRAVLERVVLRLVRFHIFRHFRSGSDKAHIA